MCTQRTPADKRTVRLHYMNKDAWQSDVPHRAYGDDYEPDLDADYVLAAESFRGSSGIDAQEVAEEVFHATNARQVPGGFRHPFSDGIIPYRDVEGRVHSSMSVGDIIQVGDRHFLCKPVGFEEVEV